MGSDARDAMVGAGLSFELGDDGIGVLEFDQPDAEHNTLTPELLERFVALVHEARGLAAEGSLRGLVVASAKPRSFIAGVDVGVIASVKTAAAGAAGARQGQLAFQALADLPVPTVAAINGTCLGGATEMALACDWRIAADADAVEIGLPEVNLGIIPGFGGTQRLPRLISIERALQMILTGRSLDARRALRQGLVDAVVPAALLRPFAIGWAGRHGKGPRRRRRAPEDRPLPRRVRRLLLEGNPLGRALLFRQASAGVRRRAAGRYPAPVSALAAVKQGLRGSLAEGLKVEADRIGDLVVHPVTRNLVGIFFLRQASRRAPDAGDPPARVRRLGVLGAGVMGGGIAQLAAYRGVAVRIKDIALEPLCLAMGVAFRRFDERRKRGKLTVAQVRRGMGLISPTLEYTGFRHADLVVEAVVENLQVKHEVLAAVEAAAGAETVLATNTSSLTVAAMAPALRDPSRFVGLHFFNPVHRMPLVEVVRGPESSERAVATAAAFATALGKAPVIVADAPGFLVNRVLTPYLNEALLLVSEGTPIAAVDAALVRFGMPMGPLRLLDEIGLDVAAKVAGVLADLFGDRIPASDASARLAADGRIGRKGGSGFYLYSDKPPLADVEVERLLASGDTAAAPEEIVDRCLLAMLNEACRALQEGIVASPMAADLALVFGTGFAPFRGGIFRYAEARGVEPVRERMAALAEQHGDRFVPEAMLDDAPFYPATWPHKLSTL